MSHANIVSMSVSGTPGTGTVTLNAAIAGFKSFSAAYGANATIPGVLFQDFSGATLTGQEVCENCVYDHGAGTITRGTRVSSSESGGGALTLSSAAVVSVVATAAFGNAVENFLGAWGALTSENSITGTATAVIGRLNVCSGTSENYTVTLPAVSGNAGKYIGFRMESGLTKFVTLDGNSTETIDGATTRIMWANETALLYCDGSTWTKVAGKTIPITAAMSRNSSQSITQSVFTKVNANNVDYDLAGICDAVTNYDMTVPRASVYELTATLRVENGSSVTGYVLIYKNGTEILRNSILAIYPHPQLSRQARLEAGSVLTLYAYHTSASAQNVSFNATIPCTMSIVEVPTW